MPAIPTVDGIIMPEAGSAPFNGRRIPNSPGDGGETLPMKFPWLKHALRGQDRLGTGCGKREAVKSILECGMSFEVDWG